MITAYVGMPGEGKTYCLTDWLWRQQRRGRITFAQFAVNDAWPLARIPDLLDDSTIGGAIALDEIGRILPARDWSNEDEIDQLVFEIHRHHGLDIGFACQHPAQVSAALRRLVGEWKYPLRVGLDPSKLLKAGKKPKWFQRPLAFRITTWFPDPNSDTGLPRIGEPKRNFEGEIIKDFPVEHSWVMYRQVVADMYDTTERIYTDGIRLELEERLKGAKERMYGEGRWVVQGGHASGAYTRLQRSRDDEAIRRRRRKGVRPTPEQSLDLAGYLRTLQSTSAGRPSEENVGNRGAEAGPGSKTSTWVDGVEDDRHSYHPV